MILRASALLLLLVSTVSAQIDVEISEVLYNPVGPDAGLERIEIHNNNPFQAASLAGWTLGVCYPGTLQDNRTYWPFPNNVVVPPGGDIVIHYLEFGFDTATDFYTGTGVAFTCVTPPKEMDDKEGSVVLFNTTNCSAFSTSLNVVDFVQWGATTHHELQAKAAGIWPGGTWVDDFPEGWSTAFDGDGDTADDWWGDSSPTLGVYNAFPGNPIVMSYGVGCAGSTGVPVLDTGGGPPAMGNETFRLDLTGALPGAPAVMGLSTSPASLPLFGCSLEIDPTALIVQLPAVTDGAGDASFGLPVPEDFTLLSLFLYLQTVVVDPGAPGGVVAFTNGVQLSV